MKIKGLLVIYENYQEKRSKIALTEEDKKQGKQLEEDKETIFDHYNLYLLEILQNILQTLSLMDDRVRDSKFVIKIPAEEKFAEDNFFKEVMQGQAERDVVVKDNDQSEMEEDFQNLSINRNKEPLPLRNKKIIEVTSGNKILDKYHSDLAKKDIVGLNKKPWWKFWKKNAPKARSLNEIHDKIIPHEEALQKTSVVSNDKSRRKSRLWQT
jgi:hypothetical protein